LSLLALLDILLVLTRDMPQVLQMVGINQSHSKAFKPLDSMLYNLFRFKSSSGGLSIWEDDRLIKWANYTLMPNDVFTIIDENKLTGKSRSDFYSKNVKVYRFEDGATGWVSLACIVQRADLLETENNI
jgi:hypothetical protein